MLLGVDDEKVANRSDNILRTGRDDSKSTMDDVLIGFDRLRRYIRYDLSLANFEVLSMERIMDKDAMKLFKGSSCDEAPEKKAIQSYDAWTESEVASNKKQSFSGLDSKDKELPTLTSSSCSICGLKNDSTTSRSCFFESKPRTSFNNSKQLDSKGDKDLSASNACTSNSCSFSPPCDTRKNSEEQLKETSPISQGNENSLSISSHRTTNFNQKETQININTSQKESDEAPVKDVFKNNLFPSVGDKDIVDSVLKQDEKDLEVHLVYFCVSKLREIANW